MQSLCLKRKQSSSLVMNGKSVVDFLWLGDSHEVYSQNSSCHSLVIFKFICSPCIFETGRYKLMQSVIVFMAVSGLSENQFRTEIVYIMKSKSSF